MQKTLELTNDIAQVPILSEWIENVVEEFGLPMQATFQLNLALEEAVVNVMNYAYPGEKEMPVRLVVDNDMEDADNMEGADLRIVLSDDGIPFDPTQAEDPDITLSAEERQIGGLGIFLVQQIMAEVIYKRVGESNVLTMMYKVSQ